MTNVKRPKLLLYHLGEYVKAFSSTRQEGYSEGCYGKFNINHYCGDSEEAIRRNRETLCQLLGIDNDHLMMPHQVHLTEMAIVDETFLQLPDEERFAQLEGVDALMTNVTGVCIGISTADCIPVLLYDKRHHAACAIHAGWRGTVKRIVEKAVAKMTTVYGTQPEDIQAQIGPGISLDSFEVGDEVYDAFVNEGFEMALISRKYPCGSRSSLLACSEGLKKSSTFHSSLLTSKWHIDLPECNRQQLLAAGIPEVQIAVSTVCTFKDSETYFSARRLGIKSGRIFTGILLL